MCLSLLGADLSSLTVLPWDSRFSAKSHGLMVRHENLTIFGKPHVFQRKSTIFLHAQKLIVVQESSHSLKQIQPQRTNKSRSARELSPKDPYLENRCQIRLSLATSLSLSESRPRDILVQIKMADFEEIETRMVFLSCSTPKKSHFFFRSPPKYR